MPMKRMKSTTFGGKVVEKEKFGIRRQFLDLPPIKSNKELDEVQSDE